MGLYFPGKEQGPFLCKCGSVFKNKARLREHIALQNPHWPAVSDTDQHAQIFVTDKHPLYVSNRRFSRA